ncbi:hypothetical protein GH714_016001 [Hevea brasiliensis]|uniref:Cytochrome P450 n=1 Tax=Hevea brasiliensis TaxID=3981 RepID=A0A6A6NHN1_HEVBR|nr:hypothetical protein GH714_016001 [Hevea brasiliensis]
MTFLMKNATAMMKAQEEVRKLVGKKGFVEEDDTQQLPYLKAVIEETMRLQPTIPLLVPRESSENCTLDGYDIPAKTVVYVNAWAIGREPEIWENPEKRICPGMFMGLATVEVSLANLLYKFDWEMPVGLKKEELDMDEQPGITMHKKNALCLMARKRNLRLPPGPKGLPLVGNLFQLDNSNVQKYLWQLSNQYGPLMSLRLGLKQTLIVSSAKMVKEVLKTQDLEFCNRPPLLGLQRLSFNGLDLAFAHYDAYWREMRKIFVVYLFNSNRVQDFRPIREDEVSHMLENISKLANDSKPVNLTEAMMALTSAAICKVAFGKRFVEGGNEAKRFHELLNETQAMFVGFFFSDYFPYIGWIVDKLSGLLSRLEKNFHEFDVFYQELIDEHLDPKREKLMFYFNFGRIVLLKFN